MFSPGRDWQGYPDGALAMAVWALVNATAAAEGGDTDLKASQFFAEWLVSNRIHFDDYCENDRLERWGAIEGKTCATGVHWYVFSGVLEHALAGGNFDRAKTLRRMAGGRAARLRLGAPLHEAEALPVERAGLLRPRRQQGCLARGRTRAEKLAELDEVRRGWDMMRRRNSRLCRKYGLKGRRERNR